MTNGIFTQNPNYLYLSQWQRRQKGLGGMDRKNMFPPCFLGSAQRKQVPGEPFERSIQENEIKC